MIDSNVIYGEAGIEFIRACFDLDPISGLLTWKTRSVGQFESVHSSKIWNSRFAGKRVGTPDQRGYLSVGLKFNGRQYALKVHRIIWAIEHGVWPAADVDHIDGNPSNNAIANLRAATNAENSRNRRRRVDNKIGVKGVAATENGRFRSQIRSPSGKLVYLGRFDTAEAASAAYAAASAKFHGEFGRAA